MPVRARREQIIKLKVWLFANICLDARLTAILILELFSLFIKDTHCKHLVLGCCHDNGYVVILDPYKHNAAATSRITLLQGPRSGREYSQLPFEKLKLNDLFREAALTPNNAIHPASPGASFTNLPWRPAESREKTSNGLVEKPTTFSRAVYPRNIYLNEDKERVDDFFPEPNAGDWANFNRRLKQQKICNEYTLKGSCNNKQCAFAHIPDLPPGEVYALAKSARLTACSAGSACRSFVCAYGHVCPNDGDCTRGNKCFFKKVHGVDIIAVEELRAPLQGIIAN